MVEVRQGTGRGWSWLRPGREHWARMRSGGEGGGEEGGGDGADIKSNHPHLTGGENSFFHFSVLLPTKLSNELFSFFKNFWVFLEY